MLPRGLLKEYFRVLILLVRSVDAAILFLSGWIMYAFKFDTFQLSTPYFNALMCGVVLGVIIFPFFQLYGAIRSNGFMAYFWRIVQAMALLWLLLTSLGFATKSGELYSRVWLAGWMLASLCSLIGSRFILLLALRIMRTRGLNERRVVIFGASEMSGKLAATIQEALWTGFRITHVLDDDAANKPAHFHQVPVMQTPACIATYLQKNQIDEVWIGLPLRAEERVKEILHELRHSTVTTRYLLDIFGLDLLNHSVTDLAGFPMLTIRSTPMMGGNRVLKAIEDRVLAALILTLISPLLLVIATAVRLSSPGPIFYRQKRIGWNGEEFEMLKFRTMPVTAEATTGPVWASKSDNRATGIGRFLRRTSLDELPQFINVLRGEMSIVGPRPERKVFVDEFKDKIPRYMQKHYVKAGITGWAQVNGWRGNTSLNKRIEYDLYYIDNWSIWFDLKIILLTFLRGFVNRNAY